MAKIPNRKKFIENLATVLGTDQGVVNLVFPMGADSLVEQPQIEFDKALLTPKQLEYNSFMQSAKIVEKDGFENIVLNPVQFNNKITQVWLDKIQRRYNQIVYEGGEAVSAEEQAMFDTALKILRDQDATKLAVVYEVLTTHKIIGGHTNEEGVKQDINLPVPAENRVINDGVTAGQEYWDNGSAKILTQIKNQYNSMRAKPNGIIMSSTEFTLMAANSEYSESTTQDNNTRTFIRNPDINPDLDFYWAGTITLPGMRNLPVYVEDGIKTVDGVDEPYLDKYVIFYKTASERVPSPAQMYYTGIPRRTDMGIETVVAQFDIQKHVSGDPVVETEIVKQSFLPTIKKGEGFASMKVRA